MEQLLEQRLQLEQQQAIIIIEKQIKSLILEMKNLIENSQNKWDDIIQLIRSIFTSDQYKDYSIDNSIHTRPFSITLDEFINFSISNLEKTVNFFIMTKNREKFNKYQDILIDILKLHFLYNRPKEEKKLSKFDKAQICYFLHTIGSIEEFVSSKFKMHDSLSHSGNIDIYFQWEQVTHKSVIKLNDPITDSKVNERVLTIFPIESTVEVTIPCLSIYESIKGFALYWIVDKKGIKTKYSEITYDSIIGLNEKILSIEDLTEEYRKSIPPPLYCTYSYRYRCINGNIEEKE